MSPYAKYKSLLGRPYIDGRFDCYGLARDYCKLVWDIELSNFARPERWWDHKEFDLINEFLSQDGWQQRGTNLRALQIGDGLVFAVGGGKANHVGIYVGNGQFIHHFYKHFSKEEALLDKWTSRLLVVVRHPGIKVTPQKKDVMELLPEHVKRRLAEAAHSEGSGAVRTDS